MPTSDEDEDEQAWRDRKLCKNGVVEFFSQTGCNSLAAAQFLDHLTFPEDHRGITSRAVGVFQARGVGVDCVQHMARPRLRFYGLYAIPSLDNITLMSYILWCERNNNSW
jgi:hypothetical protein